MHVSDHAWRPADTLGARLVLLRRELGLSQREAAARAGISFSQWQGLEDDDREVRGVLDKISRIVDTFEVDRDWLLWGGRLEPRGAATPRPPRRPDGMDYTPDTRRYLRPFADALPAIDPRIPGLDRLSHAA